MTTARTDLPENPIEPPAVGSLVERGVMQHTRGPWRVVVDEHPHRLGGTHTERRIFTEWDHPQLKGPMGVVNMSVGIGNHDQAARHMVILSAADAALIAAAPEMLIACLEVAQGYSTRGAELARLALVKVLAGAA